MAIESYPQNPLQLVTEGQPLPNPMTLLRFATDLEVGSSTGYIHRVTDIGRTDMSAAEGTCAELLWGKEGIPENETKPTLTDFGLWIPPARQELFKFILRTKPMDYPREEMTELLLANEDALTQITATRGTLSFTNDMYLRNTENYVLVPDAPSIQDTTPMLRGHLETLLARPVAATVLDFLMTSSDDTNPINNLDHHSEP